MKIEHSIYDWSCKIVSNENSKACIQIENNFYNDYKQDDFNEHFAIKTLIACNMLEKLSIGHYSVYSNNYLYDKSITQPEIPYKGELADQYTFWDLQKKKLGAYSRNPASREQVLEIFEAIKPHFSIEEIENAKNDNFMLDNLMAQKQIKILDIICQEINISSEQFRTIAWKRKSDGSFDYSLPATLFLGTVNFDEKEYNNLMSIVEQIVKNYTICHSLDTENKPIILLEVEYGNVQPKPKKTKIPAIDFKSLEGKEVTTSDYFYTLTERGWKYDREESDLFYMLSKTFWSKGLKVSLIFENGGCIPPDEEDVIKCLDFYKFDKKKYKEKTIYTQFEENSYDFDTIEEYIAYFNEQYPNYIPHSDFNTNDYELLERVESDKIPANIQKEIWEDLINCDK